MSLLKLYMATQVETRQTEIMKIIFVHFFPNRYVVKFLLWLNKYYLAYLLRLALDYHNGD